MKIAIGSDHGAFAAKEQVKEFLISLGHDVTDMGTYSLDSCDYPDFGVKVARGVASGEFERGVVMCTTGIGISIVANKVKAIRCALCVTPKMAEMSRRHNDSNVLSLGASNNTFDEMKEIVSAFLSTAFDGGERHIRRLSKIADIENGNL